jgi:hypothetical protein
LALAVRVVMAQMELLAVVQLFTVLQQAVAVLAQDQTILTAALELPVVVAQPAALVAQVFLVKVLLAALELRVLKWALAVAAVQVL